LAGAVNRKLKWAAPNKRLRRREPLLLADEVRALYSYDIAVDDSSSDESEGGGESSDEHATEQ
jgi:hypothetical protein